MDLEKLTRELGKAIQASAEYKALEEAKANNDADQKLQEQIEQFNMIRVKLSTEMQNEKPDDEKVKSLDAELKGLYAEVMNNKNMMAFNIAKQDVDDVMQRISSILVMCVNGEDPDTCEPAPSGCSGSCASCGGCH